MKRFGWSSLIFGFVVFASAITTGCTNGSRSQGGKAPAATRGGV
jgi:hypothetical protein